MANEILEMWFEEDRYESIFVAARENKPNVIELALADGFNINQKIFGRTLLMEAIEGKHRDLVHKLLRAGADVNQGNVDWVTPLCCAARQNDLVMVEMLLRHKADVTKLTDSRPMFQIRTPLHYAICFDNFEMFKLLVDYGIDINVPTLGDITPIDEAIRVQNADMVRMILEHPGFTPQPTPFLWRDIWESPLVMYENLEICRVIFESKHAALFLQIDASATLLGYVLLKAHKIHNKIDITRLLLYYGCEMFHEQGGSVYKQWLDCETSEGTLEDRARVIFTLLEHDIRPTAAELIQMQEKCKADHEPNIVQSIKDICSRPLSLEKLCQVSIRQCLGAACTTQAKLLPLPDKLCEYVATHGIDLEEVYGL